MARKPGAPLPDSFDPLEIALDAERSDRAADSPARVVLIKQAALLDADLHHRKLQIAEARVGVVLKALAGIAGMVAAAVIGLAVWSAAHERGLVVSAFSVPPDLTARGVTGQVVAQRLLDKLSEMQAATVSSRAPSTFANDWNGDIKVEIPQTGVSVGELRHVLVQWLGHQTEISGEVVRSPAGLSITARTGTEAAKPHEGADAQLDALIGQAAEDIYASTQPYRYAIYLRTKGDPESLARAKAILVRLSRTGDKTDRLWSFAALNLMLQSEGDFTGAVRATDRGIALDPRFNLLYANRAGAESGFGHDEAALADNRSGLSTLLSDGPRYMQPSDLHKLEPQWRGTLDLSLCDFAGAADAFRTAFERSPDAFLAMTATTSLIQAHDAAGAREMRTSLTPNPLLDAIIDGSVAYDQEDWAGVLRSWSSPLLAGGSAEDRQRYLISVLPYLAVAKARLGDDAAARALVNTSPADCYFCVIARGDVASAHRDWAEADRWFAEAVRQGPSLAPAHMDWGVSLRSRGNAAGAAVQFRAAAQLAPRWADPLEGWGEALLAQGDAKGAEAKFRQADHMAPHWGRNHLHWGEALARLGRPAEARAQWLTARGLDLSVSARAQLDQWLSGH